MKESFEITSVSREDLEALGFDTSEVSDATMERLASKLGDDYCEQLFWTSLGIIAEYMEIPKKEVVDKEGNPLHIGDAVVWHDPEEVARDLERVYHIDKIHPEAIIISDAYSEAEVLPEELLVINSLNEEE
jgi:hypothetical protein